MTINTKTIILMTIVAMVYVKDKCQMPLVPSPFVACSNGNGIKVLRTYVPAPFCKCHEIYVALVLNQDDSADFKQKGFP